MAVPRLGKAIGPVDDGLVAILGGPPGNWNKVFIVCLSARWLHCLCLAGGLEGWVQLRPGGYSAPWQNSFSSPGTMACHRSPVVRGWVAIRV